MQGLALAPKMQGLASGPKMQGFAFDFKVQGSAFSPKLHGLAIDSKHHDLGNAQKQSRVDALRIVTVQHHWLYAAHHALPRTWFPESGVQTLCACAQIFEAPKRSDCTHWFSLQPKPAT